MSVFLFAVIGFVVGSVAAKAVRGQSRAGVVGDLGMAFAGAVTAGWLVQAPLGIEHLSAAGLTAALVGAVVFVGIERAAAGQRAAH